MKFEATRRTARPAGRPGPMQDVFLPGSSPIFAHLQSGFYPPSEIPHFPRTLPCLRASSIPRCDRYGSSPAHPPWAAPSEKPQPALARRPASGVREMKNTRDPQRVSFSRSVLSSEQVILQMKELRRAGNMFWRAVPPFVVDSGHEWSQASARPPPLQDSSYVTIQSSTSQRCF